MYIHFGDFPEKAKVFAFFPVVKTARSRPGCLFQTRAITVVTVCAVQYMRCSMFLGIYVCRTGVVVAAPSCDGRLCAPRVVFRRKRVFSKRGRKCEKNTKTGCKRRKKCRHERSYFFLFCSYSPPPRETRRRRGFARCNYAGGERGELQREP